MEKYHDRFRKLPKHIHESNKKVNAVVFGGVGVGKSSFLNTFMTAIKKEEAIQRDFKSSSSRTGSSKTRTVRRFT